MNHKQKLTRTATALLLALAALGAQAQHRGDDRRGGGEGQGRGEAQERRGDGQRGDGQRGDAQRGDAQRGDAQRADGPRGDAPRGENPRADVPRAPRVEAPRAEAPRVDAPRHEGRPDRGGTVVETRRPPEFDRRAPVVVHGGGSEGQRWHDGAHGLNRDYPRPGYVVRQPPPRSGVVYWGGVNYRYWDSVWYTPSPRGYVVVRPPYGIVIADRPAFYSLVTIGAIAYFYANGVYYREHLGGGYEVVAAPVDGNNGSPTPLTLADTKPYVYPARGQSAERQATDEYDCHAWAVSQTGFDPSAVATGQRAADYAQRDNYQRARTACLEGRGYTVR